MVDISNTNNLKYLETFERTHLKIKKMRGLIGKRYEMTWRGNLLKLDWDGQFIQPFIDKASKNDYVGLGKCVDALVRFAYETQDSALLALRKQIIAAMLKCQEDDGYLGWYIPEARTVELWDIHEQSYVLWSLVSDWIFFKEEPSLHAAIKLGNYLLEQMVGIDIEEIGNGEQGSVASELSVIGFDRALLALSQVTGDLRYRDFVVSKLKLETWDLPIVLERHGKIEGHAYAYLTRCMAQLDLYEQTGNSDLLKQTRQTMFFLTNSLGLVSTGSCGICECWHDDQRGMGDLAETCTTAYLIRVCARLLKYDNDSKWADLMERAIYNALFAAQSLDGRQIRYYTPFDGPREYFNKDTYCCPNNFRRIISELPDFIYSLHGQTLQVNLYESSNASFDLANGQQVVIDQETNYPSQGEINFTFTLSKEANFVLRLRRPGWCDNAKLSINGKSVDAVCEKGFLVIDRVWQSGDQVQLSLAMEPRLVRGLATQQGKVAVMRGPVLYCTHVDVLDEKGRHSGNVSSHESDALATFESITIHENKQSSDDRHNVALVLCGKICDDQADASGQKTRDVTISLLPYLDPAGNSTYFKVGPLVAVVADHLLANDAKRDESLPHHDFDPNAIGT